ncbi:hypothetical protein QEG98_01470 [Myxococcus sp. MxC21-1]|uniref:hypothetical protein n=1 Tax=Myxococcus sp. MxC21-1 TaxID=3041439 RepID=UPI0029306CEC|nr:hypothetical protein [Myxococcus sp. MxC21-1]WNZ62543.1 hypothetical protein QEG98_01470 [Myxococcus sp. MxC21-1]
MKLAVTGLGLVTSVGNGVVGTCTALRAGLSQPRPLPAFTVEDEPGEAIPVTGFPAAPFADGFFQTGAWVRLASGAFDDLRDTAAMPPPTDTPFWHRTGLLVLAPLIDEARFGWSLQTLPGALETFYLRPLVSLMDVPLRGEKTRALALGHCGLAAALQQADAMLTSRDVDRVLVLAADSYVDPESLAWLAYHRRLKSPRRQVGLMPGEAGAAILLERPVTARARGSASAVQVEAVALSGPPEAGATLAQLGRALAESIQRVLPAPSPRFQGDLYLDLNGEAWRAQAWGHAQVLLADALDIPHCRVLHIASSLGETGTASAPVSLAAAAWGFFRGHATGAHTLLSSLSEAGQPAAVLLTRGEGEFTD